MHQTSGAGRWDGLSAVAASGRNGGWLVWLMSLAIVAFLVTLIVPLGQPEVSGALTLLVTWLPTTVCIVAVVRTRFRRPETILATGALFASAFGFTWYGLAFFETGRAPSFPYLADAGTVIFYPLMLGALIVLIRRKMPGLARSVLLDCAVGSLGAAALLAVILNPVIDSLATGPPSSSATIAYLCPFLDMAIVAVIAGMAALHGLDFGRRWRIFAFGLIVFTAADTTYSLILLAENFTVGTPLDAGWATAHALIAFWVAGTALPERVVKRPRVSASALFVPIGATAAGLGILILGSQVQVSSLAVFIASATLVVAAIPLVFRQLVLLRQSTTDELTKLPNRRALYTAVPVRLAAGQGRSSALLMLDLDKFKEVNDTFGHDAGDDLLIQVSQRMSAALRPGDLLARLGGDEFAIHLGDSSHDDAVDVAVAIRAAFAEPYSLTRNSVQSGVSIGIAMFPEQGRDLAELLRNADLAMYEAKASRTGHQSRTNIDDGHADARLRTLQELRKALTGDELVLHFQPKTEINSGKARGVEALVRWNHPGRGLLYPEVFLGLAEEAGLMNEVTHVVLEKALDQAAAWQAQDRPVSVAVNLPAVSLFDEDLPERIGAMLDARGLVRSALVLEVNEEDVVADVKRSFATLTGFRALGVRIAIEGNGSGRASLEHLRNFPVDEIKLDLSFIIPMQKGVTAAEETASAETIARGLDQAKGYFTSRAVPAEELEGWLDIHGGDLTDAPASAEPVVTVQRGD